MFESQNAKKKCSLFLVSVMTLLPKICFADFAMPVLFPVEKIIVVDERVTGDVLVVLSRIKTLSLEVQMSNGNMIRDVLVNRMNETMRGVTKRIVFADKVKMVHVEQIKKLDKFELVWSGDKKMDHGTFNALYELGPVRKFIEIPGSTKISDLVLVSRLKFYTPVIILGNKPLGKQIFNWLENNNHKKIRFVISADFPPERIYDLCKFKSISLEVRTINNSVPIDLLNVLQDLRGVDTIFTVDGRLTLQDVRTMTVMERFSLKVELGHPPGYTPGLAKMLNLVSPPRMHTAQ